MDCGARQNKTPVVPFVVIFSQQLSFLNSALKTTFQVAQNKISTLAEFEMITAYRWNKNLRDILVQTS